MNRNPEKHDSIPKKKKQPKTQWLILLGYLLIGAACGVLMLSHVEHLGSEVSQAGKALRFLLLFACMYAAMTVQIIIHEAGHLVFGLISGYRFNSFRIFNLMLLRQNGKLRLKKLSVAGTGGQCLMNPPDLKNGRMPVMLYNFGGSLLNLITALLFGAGALLCPAGSFGRAVLLFPVIIGAAFALMNGLPLRSGAVNNDGSNALELSRSPEAVRAFWIQMKANELISRGVRIKNMPAEWFEMPSEEAMKNGIIATVGVLACSRLMDEQHFEEADRLMARVLSGQNGVAGLHRALLTCDRMYLELIGPNRPDVLQRMQSREQLKIMKAMKTYPSVLRTEYTRALLGEKSADKAAALLKQFEKAAAAYPYPGEIEAERELIRLAQDRAAQETGTVLLS